MEKTIFSFEKAMVSLKNLKFLTLSVVFTLLFMGVGLKSNAQASLSPTANGAGVDAASLFKSEVPVQRGTALDLLKSEIAVLKDQNPSNAIQERDLALKLYFYKEIGSLLKNNEQLELPRAVSAGYYKLASHAQNFQSGSSAISGILQDAVDLLTL